MKRILVALFTVFTVFSITFAQSDNNGVLEKYRRSSLEVLSIIHPADSFYNEIMEAVQLMPFPDKYNKHGIDYTFVEGSPHGEWKTDLSEQISDFLKQDQTAKKMVAKWFNFNENNGNFDVSLLQERGLYNASEIDYAVASGTMRGNAILEDAGEELINNTYVIVNDIKYVDHKERSENFQEISNVIGSATDEITSMLAGTVEMFGGNGGLIRATGGLVAATSEAVAATTNMLDISGFIVRIESYLYQLNWNDSVATVFYHHYWTNGNEPEKIAAFINDSTTFNMKYIGKTSQYSNGVKFYSAKTSEEQILGSCTRVLDQNIASLQKNYEDFRVKTPIYQEILDKKGKKVIGYSVKIGMKEGITSKSKFQVLQRLEDENGRTYYKIAGTLSAQKGKVWDNRYLATKEHEIEEAIEEDELLTSTILKKGKGSIYPGMLVIEGKYSKARE